MPGNNHYADCLCGWCVKMGRGRRARAIYWSPDRSPTFTTYASFTIPNAACPVCGASVFFYQSPFGGRVFFDELGPPWPKHPCTDNAASPVSRPSSSGASRRPVPAWRKNGWEPITLQSSRMIGNWHILPVKNIITGLYFDVLADEALRVDGEVCAFMKPWDANGWSQISIFNLDRERETSFNIFQRKRFERFSRVDAVATRRRRAKS